MAEVEQARRRYEALLDVETLKVNLQDALDRRDQLYERISHWCVARTHTHTHRSARSFHSSTARSSHLFTFAIL